MADKSKHRWGSWPWEVGVHHNTGDIWTAFGFSIRCRLFASFVAGQLLFTANSFLEMVSNLIVAKLSTSGGEHEFS